MTDHGVVLASSSAAGALDHSAALVANWALASWPVALTGTSPEAGWYDEAHPAGMLDPSSTTSILALWTTGMSFFLPSSMYLVALALYLVTVVACFRDKDAFGSPACSFCWYLGMCRKATYHQLLVIIGAGFLAGALRGSGAVGSASDPGCGWPSPRRRPASP